MITAFVVSAAMTLMGTHLNLGSGHHGSAQYASAQYASPQVPCKQAPVPSKQCPPVPCKQAPVPSKQCPPVPCKQTVAYPTHQGLIAPHKASPQY